MPWLLHVIVTDVGVGRYLLCNGGTSQVGAGMVKRDRTVGISEYQYQNIYVFGLLWGDLFCIVGLFVSMIVLSVPTRGSHDAAAAGGTEIVFSERQTTSL